MKVLVVDDSALMRRYLKEMLLNAGGFDVVLARDGQDALEVIAEHDPDIITLDINMPVMDGLTCLSHIMTRYPRPVLMVSSLTEKGALATFEAIEMGAVDYVAKPGGTVSLNIRAIEDELIEKLRVFGKASRRRARRPRQVVAKAAEPPRRSPPKKLHPQRVTQEVSDSPLQGVVVVGVSTGGPSALQTILPNIPADFPLPIVVCQHMPGSFTQVFANRINGYCPLQVVEVERPMRLENGKVYVAKGDRDCTMVLRSNQPYLITNPIKEGFAWHPSVSRLVESVMGCFPADRMLCVMLTGMGNDGCEEMLKVFRNGGICLAQDEASSVVYGMPKSLVDENGATKVVNLNDMAQQMSHFANKISARGVIASWA